MVFIYRTSNHLGGAFPSSHIAIAIVLIFPSKYIRPLHLIFALSLPFSFLLLPFIVHYHWFIDTRFGILTGIAGYYLANFGLLHNRKKGSTVHQELKF